MSITFKQLGDKLESLGFEKFSYGPHPIFEHTEKEIQLLLPKHTDEDVVPIEKLELIKNQLIEKGIINTEEFDNFIIE